MYLPTLSQIRFRNEVRALCAVHKLELHNGKNRTHAWLRLSVQDAKPEPVRYASFRGTLLHYAQDGQPAYCYGLDQRSALDASELDAVPCMNLRHEIKPKRSRAAKQTHGPGWRAKPKPSAQTATMASASRSTTLAAMRVSSSSTGTSDRTQSSIRSDARSPPAKRRRH